MSLALLLLPVSTQFVVIIHEFRNWIPVWASYPDPGYQYLLSGVVVIDGGTPLHNDHPGTSVQWIIGITEWLLHQVSGVGSLTENVVARPEYYSQWVGAGLALLYLSSLIFIAWRLLTTFGLLPSLAFQLVMLWGLPLFSVARFKLMPETIALTCAILVLGVLAPVMSGKRTPLSVAAVISLGIISAIGLTAKILFVPVLFVIFVLSSRRNLLVFVPTLIGATVLILVPIRSRLDYMRTWFWNIFTNPGRQGQPLDSWDAGRQWLDSLSNVSGFVRWYALGLIVIGVTVAIGFLAGDKSENVRRWRPVLAVALGLAATLALGVKPIEVRDWLLTIPLLATLAAIAMAFLLAGKSWAYRGLSLLLLLTLMFGAAHGVVQAQYFTDAQRNQARDLQVSTEALARDTRFPSMALGYNVWTEATALVFALPWMNGEVSTEVADRFPQAHYYNPWTRDIHDAQGGSIPEACKVIRERQLESGLAVVVHSPGHLGNPMIGDRVDFAQFSARVALIRAVEGLHIFDLDEVECE